jgi:site-specific DNA-methyltransferase (adenine-specific)
MRVNNLIEIELKQHPTQKPLDVIRKLIIHHSKEHDLICDPFMGSGTTAVACKQLNRNFIGFEISQEYVNIANERLKQTNLREWNQC